MINAVAALLAGGMDVGVKATVECPDAGILPGSIVNISANERVPHNAMVVRIDGDALTLQLSSDETDVTTAVYAVTDVRIPEVRT